MVVVVGAVVVVGGGDVVVVVVVVAAVEVVVGSNVVVLSASPLADPSTDDEQPARPIRPAMANQMRVADRRAGGRIGVAGAGWWVTMQSDAAPR